LILKVIKVFFSLRNPLSWMPSSYSLKKAQVKLEKLLEDLSMELGDRFLN